ncbi:MAG: hypothetical protein UH963_05650 [Agathobacter sp.]|nr:hypothetical protein [Agathobacter sp.]
MEEKNQLQNSLEDWAQETIEAYHKIAQEVNLAFYTQSDLSILRESPELAIVGINPGGKEKDTYEGQRKNKHWSYLYDNPSELDKNHLLKGNYCHEEWKKHKKWSYWSRLKHCLEKTYLKDVIDDDSKIIVTNASFFSTPTAKEIEEWLLEKTIPYTLELIKITTPKHLIFLGGNKCFKRLDRLSKNTLKFEYKQICGNIYVGNLNGKLCIGIPHPAYKTTEELNLIASVMSFVINQKNYKDIDVEVIKKECSEQIRAYKERIINHKKTSGSIDKNQIVIQVISRLMTFFDENSLVEKQEPELYRFKLNDELILTITSKEQGYIAIRGKNKNNDLTDKYSQILKRFEFLPIDKVWLGKKNFKAFGNSVEDVVNSIVDAVTIIKTETEMN